ncbi:MAG TPA: glycosyltransferase family 4 protein, partial [Syntrophales bacterium]|nr:glycosyltransferase family 4 protein [Syntrophales bacterium]HOM08472.1 glycosyltransferase family 4 protein [Syntrophales bacterium]
MKILCISDVSIHQVIGGAERVLYEQAVGLQRRGHEVHVMTRRLDTHEAAAGDICGVREWRYEVETENPFSFLLTTLSNGSRLFRKLDESVGFDTVNAHQPFSAWAAIRGGLGKRPFVYTCHSLSFEEYLSRRRAQGRRHRILDTINVHLRKKIEKTV